MNAVRAAVVRERLRVAAVQYLSRPGELAAAVADHVRWIAEAADAGASVVLFPELSLTGYEPDAIDLHDIRISTDDDVLQPLSVICQQRKVHAFIGAPTVGAALPQIGVLHVDTRGSVRVAYALYVIGTEQRLEEQMVAVTRAGMWAVLAQFSGGTGGGPACGLGGAWRPDGTPVARLGAGPGMALADLAG